ncbi:hypothetical protein GCM10009539_83190 [Cryptosporangium japonicum]|uniref:Uncharacterized protein n=1 Tax=Cryptosporangium japonicum TaxID=80872 RepID=A0ABN0VA31_9ACTN
MWRTAVDDDLVVDAVLGEPLLDLPGCCTVWRRPSRRWGDSDVAPLSSGAILLRNEVIGEVRLEHLVLQPADAPDQKLVTFRGDDDVLRRLVS